MKLKKEKAQIQDINDSSMKEEQKNSVKEEISNL